MTRRILITGGSIAGYATAWWLSRYGFDVTVVEKAAEFRDGGQNIDIRGAGREVIKLMGLEAEALASGTGEEGTAFLRADGSVAARFITQDLGTDGPTAEMEILRGDLARLLFESTGEGATFRFNDTIASIENGNDRASVTFANGKSEDFDAVIVAEGVGSSTRDLVFPGENHPRWMDMSIAYFTIPRVSTDNRLWRWAHTTRGRSVSLRPDSHGTTRAALMVQMPPGAQGNWSVDEQKAWLQQEFKDVGWEAPRILREMETTSDFYFDVLRQVRMPRWSNDRVVLTGDAAWCVTPLGGVGATLAVVGAYILAGEMRSNRDYSSAFSAYERKLRAFVEQAQGIRKIVPRLANPHSRFGLAVLHTVVRIASQPTVSKVLNQLASGRSKDIDLPHYDRSWLAAIPPNTLHNENSRL